MMTTQAVRNWEKRRTEGSRSDVSGATARARHTRIQLQGLSAAHDDALFREDPYLDSDPIFAPTDGLIVKLARYDDPVEIKKAGVNKPFWGFNFDFALVPLDV